MTTVLAIASGLLLVVGALFALVGAIGILRFPDALSRMHAASKAGTLGSGFCLLSVAVHETTFDVTTRAVAAVLFFFLTAPVSAHLIGRAIRIAGYPAVLNYDAMAPKTHPPAPNDRAANEDKSAP